MLSLSSLTVLAHLFGLALAIGAATAKLVLLWKVRIDPGLAPAYINLVKPITLVIVIGTILVTLSGIAWLLQGYPVTPRLIAKIIMVAMIWLLGPVIDKVLEPKFKRLAPAAGEAASPVFKRVTSQYLAVEALADAIFYAVVVMWVLR